jgi:hypothetical protein
MKASARRPGPLAAIASVLALVAAGCLAGLGCGQDRTEWTPFEAADGSFSASMPGVPEEGGTEVPSAFGSVSSHTWVHQERTRAFSIAHTDYPDGIRKQMTDEQFLDTARDAAVQKTRGRLVSETPVALSGHPGREVRIDDAGGGGATVQGRLYVVDSRLYQVMVTTTPEGADSPDVATFLDSFQLAPDGG